MKLILTQLLAICFVSCAAYQKLNDPYRNMDTDTKNKINAEIQKNKEENQAYICSDYGSYEAGFNDGQSGHPMNAKKALSICGANLPKYLEKYKKGYLESSKNPNAKSIKPLESGESTNAISAFVGSVTNNNSSSSSTATGKKSCIEAYGKKACGYDCKEAYGQLACAQNPEDNCVVSYGKIRCGFKCEAKHGDIKCGEEN